MLTLACQQALPAATKMQLVYGAGVTGPSGLANDVEKRFDFDVREPFTASFSCERENAKAPCTPLRPLRLRFSSPIAARGRREDHAARPARQRFAEVRSRRKGQRNQHRRVRGAIARTRGFIDRTAQWTEGRQRSHAVERGSLSAQDIDGAHAAARDPLVIDPILTYATYYGGQGDEAGRQITVDAAGNLYMAGWSTSFFPATPGSLQPQLNGSASSSFVGTGDAVVMKLNPAGTAVIYATYLGGTNDDAAMGIVVDSAGNAYLSGATQSSDFPTTKGAFQTTFGGASSNNTNTFGDAFIAKLNPDGNQLIYSTYLGGSESDDAMGIAIDSAGNAYVTGSTASKNFPVTNGVVQSSYRGGDTNYPGGDVFVAKLNPTGTALVYSTFLGAGGDERGMSIAVDSNGNAYVAGCSNSQNFPTTTGAYQTHYGGGGGEPMALMGLIMGDAIVFKLNSTGTALIYSTYVGGLSDDCASAIAIDSLGNAYITGGTLSVNFPTTTGAFQTKYGLTGGGQPVRTGDAFVTKLNAAGTGLVYSTYLGGNLDDVGLAISVDSTGNAYVAGGTSSANFPVSADATQPKLAGFGGQNYTALADAFVTKLNPTGSGILFSTYLGGELDDVAFGMAVDSAGNIFLSGNTASTKFPVTAGAVQTRYGGARGGILYPQGDIFLARIGQPVAIPVTITVAPATVTLTASQTQQFIATVTNSTNVAVTWTISPPGSGSISTSGLYSAPTLIPATQVVTVTATSAADTTKLASATVTLNPTPPVVSAANVVNGASLAGGPVTPGMIVNITGGSFGPANPVQGAPDPNTGALATNVGGTQVLFDNNPAPIISASSGTVVAIVPYEVAGNPTTQMQVVYQGVSSALVTVPVTDVSPALFAADSSGAGQGLIYNSDASPNSDANPAPIESNITIIGTGEGQTMPPGTDGLVPGDTPPMPIQPVVVSIGGVNANVVSAGGAPGLPAGYFQVTVTIPDGVTPGDLPVVVMVGSGSSQGGITVAVSPVPSQ